MGTFKIKTKEQQLQEQDRQAKIDYLRELRAAQEEMTATYLNMTILGKSEEEKAEVQGYILQIVEEIKNVNIALSA